MKKPKMMFGITFVGVQGTKVYTESKIAKQYGEALVYCVKKFKLTGNRKGLRKELMEDGRTWWMGDDGEMIYLSIQECEVVKPPFKS